MRKISVLVAVVFLTISVINAQVKKVIKVKDFTEFKLEGSSTVYLIPSDTNGLVLEMKKDEVACYLDIDNDHGKLIINTTDKNKNLSNTFSKLTIYVYYKDLKIVTLEGKGKIVTKDTLRADIFEANLSGTGNFHLIINCNYFKADMDGTGTFKVCGKAKEAKVEVSGVGGYKGYELITQTTSIDVEGVGKSEVYATDLLDAELSGVGSIRYKGDPKTKDFEVDGVGSIKPGK